VKTVALQATCKCGLNEELVQRSASSSKNENRNYRLICFQKECTPRMSFNCYSEEVIYVSADEFTWISITISGRTINNLLYADDIFLIATFLEAFQKVVHKVDTLSRKYGLALSSNDEDQLDRTQSRLTTTHRASRRSMKSTRAVKC